MKSLDKIVDFTNKKDLSDFINEDIIDISDFFLLSHFLFGVKI